MRPFICFVGTALSLFLAEPAGQADEGPQPPQPSVVYPDREAATGAASLKVNGFLLQQSGKPREFTFLSLWRYDSQGKKWRRVVVLRDGKPVALRPEQREVYSRKTDRELVRLPDEVGLYWAEWQEDGRRIGALVVSGPVLCNDVHLGAPPKGMIATCVPFADHAEAMFVPDPEVHCRE